MSLSKGFLEGMRYPERLRSKIDYLPSNKGYSVSTAWIKTGDYIRKALSDYGRQRSTNR